MSNPLSEPGWNLNRYLLSTAASVALTLFALLPPLGALAGWSGVAPLGVAGYAVIALALPVELLRRGASGLQAPGARRTCLEILQAFLWSVAVLSVPALALDLAWRFGHGRWAQAAGEDRILATIALVCAVLAAAAAANLALFLRSRLWNAFRAFALEEDDVPKAR